MDFRYVELPIDVARERLGVPPLDASPWGEEPLAERSGRRWLDPVGDPLQGVPRTPACACTVRSAITTAADVYPTSIAGGFRAGPG